MRCFIALPLASELRDVMTEAWAKAEKPLKIRRIAEGQWHVTLAFLGDVTPNHVGDLIRVCNRQGKCPGTITFNEFRSFPHDRPRMIVASGEPEPINMWKMFVDQLRDQCAIFSPAMDRKPWRAHVTLARSAPDTCLLPWSSPIGPWTWQPGGFILYESRLEATGSKYRVIHEFPFTH